MIKQKDLKHPVLKVFSTLSRKNIEFATLTFSMLWANSVDDNLNTFFQKSRFDISLRLSADTL